MPKHLSAVEVRGNPHQIPAWASPELARGQPRGSVVYVLAHGYGGSRGTWSEVSEQLVSQGFDVVIPAMPAHDTSPDPTSGFGKKEAAVVIESAEWALERYEERPTVVLVGVSMGGAACWLASAEKPRLADAIVTEGAFARLDETVDRWFDMVLPKGSTVLRPVRWFATRMSNVDPSSINPVEAAALWSGRTSLVIHAESDALMPESHAVRLAEAAGCELWRVPEAEHAACSACDLDEYVRRLRQIAAAAKPVPQ